MGEGRGKGRGTRTPFKKVWLRACICAIYISCRVNRVCKSSSIYDWHTCYNKKLTYRCKPRIAFRDINLRKIPWPSNRGYGSLKVIGNVTIRYSACDFLLMFNSKYMALSSDRFWDIQSRKMSRPWNTGPRSRKVIESGTIR